MLRVYLATVVGARIAAFIAYSAVYCRIEYYCNLSRDRITNLVILYYPMRGENERCLKRRIRKGKFSELGIRSGEK